jgi:hypothetical protein
VKKLFLWFLCFTIVVAVLWTIFVGSSGKGGAIGIQRFVEIERKAQNDVDRAYEQQQKIAKDKEERGLRISSASSPRGTRFKDGQESCFGYLEMFNEFRVHCQSRRYRKFVG